jgi:hypothetical protein
VSAAQDDSRGIEPAALVGAPTEGAAEPDGETAFGPTHLRELLAATQAGARGMLEAEEALHLVRERFELTEDMETKAELAAEALDHVERQMELTRERRRQLDSTEGKLWARQNRLEGFLIGARGAAWWRARRDALRQDAQARFSNTSR